MTTALGPVTTPAPAPGSLALGSLAPGSLAPVPLAPGSLAPGEHDDSGTRDRVRSLVVTEGPIDAARLAELLHLTPAGVRRHLAALVSAGEITERSAPSGVPRGRGRPSREYVATRAAQGHLADTSAQLATDALRHIASVLGREGVSDFADQRYHELEARYRPLVEAAGEDLGDRARSLAAAMTADGFAASTRTAPGLFPVLQLCQGHCPVQPVAAQFPELCEAETRLIARLLGVHVQRLATIAAGGHACTTTIPLVGAHAVGPTPQAPPHPSTQTTHPNRREDVQEGNA